MYNSQPAKIDRTKVVVRIWENNFKKIKKCGPTADNIQCALRQYLVDVDGAVDGRGGTGGSSCVQFLDQLLTLIVENVEETLQNLEMESRGQQSATASPSQSFFEYFWNNSFE